MKLSIKCKLDNIVTNLDGTTTFSFRQDKVSNASRLKYINYKVPRNGKTRSKK